MCMLGKDLYSFRVSTYEQISVLHYFLYTLYMYVYIYTEREGVREKERESEIERGRDRETEDERVSEKVTDRQTRCKPNS